MQRSCASEQLPDTDDTPLQCLQVQLHEANAARCEHSFILHRQQGRPAPVPPGTSSLCAARPCCRHAAEKELQRLRLPAAQHQADTREREVLSLRSMLRSALDENAKLQAQLGVANRRLADLSSQPPLVLQQQRRGPMPASWAWEETSEPQPTEDRAMLSACLNGEGIRAVGARQEQAPQQPQPQCSALAADGELKAACHQPNSILLLKAKLEQVAAAAAEDEEKAGNMPGCASSQAPLPAIHRAPGQEHTSTSFSAGHRQHGEACQAHQPGLRLVAPPQQLPPAAPCPPPELQQVYQEIRALQERLKAAEARFGEPAPSSRPGSPGSRALSPPRSRPLSPSHGPDPDWHLIHQLRQRKARAESAQLVCRAAWRVRKFFLPCLAVSALKSLHSWWNVGGLAASSSLCVYNIQRGCAYPAGCRRHQGRR